MGHDSGQGRDKMRITKCWMHHHCIGKPVINNAAPANYTARQDFEEKIRRRASIGRWRTLWRARVQGDQI